MKLRVVMEEEWTVEERSWRRAGDVRLRQRTGIEGRCAETVLGPLDLWADRSMIGGAQDRCLEQ